MSISIKLYFYFLILIPFTIFLIQHLSDLQTLNALIPEPGSLPLLKDKSVTLSDPKLKMEIFATGLKNPTNMAFLDSGDALVLEKINGTVRKIVNGKLLPEPLLDVNVATYDTRGMLGIAVAKNETANKEYIFVYYTEARDGRGDGEDKCFSPSKCIPGYLPNGNRLYRYELSDNGSKLINQKLIFSWPPLKRADHNGGELILGPDNNLYLVVGDAGNKSEVLNNKDSPIKAEGMGGILAFNHNGGPISSNGLLGTEDALNRYYAYGVRNGFGLDFDPITGKLWDTENGPKYGDEINLVEPGFNSGWRVVQGFSWKPGDDKTKLEDFGGRGIYSDPELVWNYTIAPTAIKFLNSHNYGKKYENDVFVGSASGYLYHFDLNPKRTGLDLPKPLQDKIVDNHEDEELNVIFGKNFGVISDIEVGPDGYLYVVAFSRGEIYRIIPQQ
jgi:glucose/arabinose dehydrogenase